MDASLDREACKAPAERARGRADASLDRVNSKREEVMLEERRHQHELQIAQDREEIDEQYQELWEQKEKHDLEVERLEEALANAKNNRDVVAAQIRDMAAQANAASPPGSIERQESSEGKRIKASPADDRSSAPARNDLQDQDGRLSRESAWENSPTRRLTQPSVSQNLPELQTPKVNEQAATELGSTAINSTLPTPKKPAFPQPLQELAPNIVEIDGKYEALFCAIEDCFTNQNSSTLKLFNGMPALKSHTKSMHNEEFKATFGEGKVTGQKFLNTSFEGRRFVGRTPVAGNEIDQIRATGTLPQHLQPRGPGKEFTCVPQKRKKSKASQSSPRKRQTGVGNQVVADGTEVEVHAESVHEDLTIDRA